MALPSHEWYTFQINLFFIPLCNCKKRDCLTTFDLLYSLYFSAWVYYKTNEDSSIFLSVWRNAALGPEARNYYQMVGKNRIPPGSRGKRIFRVKPKYRIQVQAGDFIGYHYSIHNKVWHSLPLSLLVRELGPQKKALNLTLLFRYITNLSTHLEHSRVHT